jgi:hypothetical protein
VEKDECERLERVEGHGWWGIIPNSVKIKRQFMRWVRNEVALIHEDPQHEHERRREYEFPIRRQKVISDLIVTLSAIPQELGEVENLLRKRSRERSFPVMHSDNVTSFLVLPIRSTH